MKSMKFVPGAITGLVKRDVDGKDLELEICIRDAYAPAFRTACLILGNPSDAEESVQEAFLRAWRFRTTLTAESNIQAWLYRVVVNACFSRLRREIPDRDRRASNSLLEHLTTQVGVPDIEVTASETRRLIYAALMGLPLHLRIPVILRYYAGLSEAEIALAIQRRQGTVKSRLHEARKRLAERPELQTLVAGEYISVKEKIQ